ncbi:MAG: sugar phosphate isomerase/epimerase [Candidatus Dormibacteraeota bacterium]|nr:sugar phosphate isomerase/epimerase [Candidatus Dormibacteraeota bacterium]
MKLGYQTNTWGGVVGHPAGVTSVKDLYYLANGSTAEAVRDIAAAGYQGFELFDGNLVAYEGRQDALHALMQETGLALVGVYSGANFIYPDILADELWRIEHAARLAAEFGAAHLVVGGGGVRASGVRDADYDRLADGLEQVVALAQKYGLTPNYHPHLGTIVETPEQLARVMPKTSIYLCPDTGHVDAAGGQSAALVREYGDRIRYIHLKDYQGGNFLPLGEGQVDFPAILDALAAHQFNGWITVELDSYAGAPKEPAIRSREYLEGRIGKR